MSAVLDSISYEYQVSGKFCEIQMLYAWHDPNNGSSKTTLAIVGENASLTTISTWTEY
jgi:hypothetical protein